MYFFKLLNLQFKINVVVVVVIVTIVFKLLTKDSDKWLPDCEWLVFVDVNVV